MDTTGKRGIMTFIGALIMDIFFVWFGFKLLVTDAAATEKQLFSMGMGSIIAGIIVMSSRRNKNLVWGSSLVLIGFYFFARANGRVESEWLLRSFGLASLAAASILTYICWPQKRNQEE